MLNNWLSVFFFRFKMNKTYVLLNLFGISIGFAGLIFAILYWNDEHSYDAWNPYKNKVFQVINDMGENTYWATNPSALEEHLKTIPAIENYCYLDTYYNPEYITFNGKDHNIKKTLNSQSEYFDFFPYQFIYGNPKTALTDATAIVLEKKTAERIFGTENPMNKTLLFRNASLIVKGVFKNDTKSSYAPEIVVNQQKRNMDESRSHWGNFSFGLLLKLKNADDKEKVIHQIENLYFENRTKKDALREGMSLEDYVKKYGKKNVILQSLSEARLNTLYGETPEGKGNKQFLIIMMGLSLLIIILSIVNYMNLANADALMRAKEMGVRKITGASKWNIILQFLFETFVVTSVALLLALALVEIILPYYNEFLNKEMELQGSLFIRQIFLIFLIVLFSAGILPAFYLSQFQTIEVLKGNFSRSKKGIWLRNAMLMLQFSIASFFIVGSIIVYQQVNYMINKDLGFKGEQIITIPLNFNYDFIEIKNDFDNKVNEYYNTYNTYKQELSKIKGVKQVATGAFRMGSGEGSTSDFFHNGEDIIARNMGVDFGMLEMLQVKLKEGRFFDPKLASDSISSLIVNETALKMMKEKNAIGKTIQWQDQKLTLIGVVQDFHLTGLQDKIEPMVFFHLKTVNWMILNSRKIYIKIEPENMDKTINEIEKYWMKNMAKTKGDFEYEFVDKSFSKTYENFVKQKNLFFILTSMVILIALFGLFALASYSIQRRMKEIAIRKTLGAETPEMLKILTKQYLYFSTIGFVITLFPILYFTQKWLDNFAYRIQINFVPFLISYLILVFLTLAIVLLKAYKATQIEVLNYIKYE